MESFQKLTDKIASTQADVTKAEAGNKAAGTRVRVAMQEIKKLAQDVRNDVTALKGE